ncbi:MAG: MATE family efflux transporter [Candidatus Methanomethylophilaceae archaeon]
MVYVRYTMEFDRELTDDAKTMLGDPRKAVIAMAIPMIVATVVQSANNIIDAVWVSGLGKAALAATGVAFPFFFIVMGIGNGIGVGASQALARRLGAGDYEGTNRVASQTIMMSLVAGMILAVALTLLAEPAMAVSGAGDYLAECLEYAVPLFVCIPFIMVSAMFSALLRAEGSSKRSMMIQLAAALLNIVLDPIFIYVLGWGLAGAAWATCIAMSSSMVFGIYWYYIRRDTFVRIPLRGFRFDRSIDLDILKVGIPASMEMIVMSVTAIIMNQIILIVDPVDGIAIYSTGWRALDMLTIPAMAFGFSLVPICAAAYGADRMDKFREAFSYSMRLGTGLMCVLTVFTLVAAPAIVFLFTYSDATASLAPEMVTFLRIGAVFLPFITVSFASSGMFQSLGMGVRSLISTLTMNLLRVPICAALAGFGTLSYLWWGMSVSEIIGAAIIGGWAVHTLRSLMKGRGTHPA